MSRKQRRRAEAESGERTIADCITFGGNYGIEMAGAKDLRKAVSARRKQKAEAKAEKTEDKNEKREAHSQTKLAVPQVTLVNGKIVAQAAQAMSASDIVSAAKTRLQ